MAEPLLGHFFMRGIGGLAAGAALGHRFAMIDRQIVARAVRGALAPALAWKKR